MGNINNCIRKLVNYGLNTGLTAKEDEVFTINRLLEILGLDDFEDVEKVEDVDLKRPTDLEELLNEIMDDACERGVIKENSPAYRDLFDTKLMAALTPRPSTVISKFESLYEKSPKEATDFYYKFSQDTDYIRRSRIARDRKWTVDTEYGRLDITINLSKPEKDPKAVAAAKNAPASAYPKCLLCPENEGYAGRLNHPARQNHRIIPLTIDGGEWGFQYSPYVYYNEHCILFNKKHIPMKIDKSAFRKLLDFESKFPHYFIGSNADLPIVGGSILAHEHFQGGHYEFAMERAKIRKEVKFEAFPEIEAGIVEWPMSVIRIRHEKSDVLVEAASHILDKWRAYSDEAAYIFAETDGEMHNTITPIARVRDGKYELDLVLRNNITTEEHPLGLYHPHKELHHIKKENIGLIEVMGLAVLPARLKGELGLLREFILEGKDVASDETIAKHAEWVVEFMAKYDDINENNIDKILEDEVGLVFKKVLEDAGVFKNDINGQDAFMKFIETV